MKYLLLYLFITSAICFGATSKTAPLFVEVPAKKSKVTFQNTINENKSFNYFYYDNIYNGSGVAVGDINNDGLEDIYFVSNQSSNELYLNLGKMKFKNITQKAFPNQDNSGWQTAVTMVDINADGWLDIYVCKHGIGQSEKVEFRNLLYINNRNNTFTEKAAYYGIDDPGRSMDADFFDYDQDGDLDLLVTNHRENLSVHEIYTQQKYVELFHSNRLYRNDGDHFTDVTKAAGILSFGYCLSASISDLNNDGWPDIFISSDYSLPDFLFINQRNGKFKNETKLRMRHTSHYSMGVDIADFNNDLFSDVCVPDMSNKDYVKSKTNMGSMSIGTFWDNVAKGYNHQYMYNALHLNLGSAYFSEIAQLAGVASTDWSWTPLFADFDQDGLKDLFISNGFFRDVRDQDFTQKLKNYLSTKPAQPNTDSIIALIPQSKEVNFVFRNKGNLEFEDVSSDWGFQKGSISHGAAYADFDNDGDLDLVINNLNEPAQIFENTLEQKKYLKLKLKGSEKNPFAVGTKIIVHTDAGNFMQEIYPSRGYASSSQYNQIIGLGNTTKINSVEIIWNAAEQTTLPETSINTELLIDYKTSRIETTSPLFLPPTTSKTLVKLSETEYDDYKNEVLLPHKMSELGPFLAKGNINKTDTLEDLFIGGTKNNAAQIYEQKENGKFELSKQPALEKDSMYEDAGALFFDADNDGDLDLYVAGGSNEFKINTAFYEDRLYINDGNGNFQRDRDALPAIYASTQKVLSSDLDQDGDNDLLVFGRQIPGKYPLKASSYILINEGGKFSDKTEQFAPEFKNLGMVTDACFAHLNDDNKTDLIIVGEWMKPLCFFALENHQLQSIEKINSCESLYGWWNAIEPIDINNDGKNEFLLGNTGLNNKFHPSTEFPLSAYLEDFDQNGKYDLVLTKYFAGALHPVRGRGCLSEQIPEIKQRYETYQEFATTPITELFQFNSSPEKATQFANGILMWENDQMIFQSFSNFGQIGCINAFIPCHINGDEHIDFIAFGNKYEAEIETPRYDANPGLVFINLKGTGNFEIYPLEQNGPFINKNAKDAVRIGNYIFVSNSGESVNYIELN